MSKALLKFLFLLTVTIFSLSFVTANANPEFDSLLKKASGFKNKNSDSVFYYTLSAFELSKELGDPRLEFKSLIKLAIHNLKMGNYGEAITNCLEAEKIVELNNFSEYEFEVLMYKGVAYKSVGLSSDALRLFIEAHKHINDTINYKEKIKLNFYIGSVYSEISEFDKSYQHLQSSIKLSKENDYQLGTYDSYILLSNIFTNQDSINKYLGLAIELIEKYPKLKYRKVILLINQAIESKGIGKLDLSRNQYLEAINIASKNGFREYLSTIYNNYAYLLMAESKYDSASYYLDQALDISIKIKSLVMEFEIYDSYSDYYERIGDFENALKYTDLYNEKRNIYREEQRIQESLFISAVFETEQKEKEILQQKNEINRLWLIQLSVLIILLIVIGFVIYFKQKFSLSKSRLETVEKGKALEIADALIQGQDAERKRLAMDLHDGLGARLGALRFMVDGFFKSNEKYDEVTNSIVNIHQNVRDLSHRMLPTQLDELGLISTIKNMTSTINKSGKFNVEFDTNIDQRLTNKQELNLYYLIYELINNATKHSNGNTIFVQLYKHDYSLSLSVEDNGGGFKANETGEGMGLKNIKTRVEYMGGTLFVESNDNETQFMIEIPNS